jgi:hypothetical protein
MAITHPRAFGSIDGTRAKPGGGSYRRLRREVNPKEIAKNCGFILSGGSGAQSAPKPGTNFNKNRRQ